MSEPLIDLDLASAHLYLSVVELGSISKAAARHGLSQPSASQRIRKLERQVGLTLLDRSTSGSALTPDGREIARSCRRLVTAAGVVLAETRVRREQQSLHTSVAASAGIARHLLPQVCADLAAGDAPLTVEVRVVNTLDACGLVRGGSSDLGLVDGPLPPLAMNSEIVTTRELQVVAAPSHPWVTRNQPVSAAELAGAPMIVRHRGSGTRDVVEDGLARAGQPLNPIPAAEAETTEAVLAGVTLDPGLIAVVAADDARPEIAAGRLAPVVCDLAFGQPVRLVWSGDEPRSEGARRFAQAARRLTPA